VKLTQFICRPFYIFKIELSRLTLLQRNNQVAVVAYTLETLGSLRNWKCHKGSVLLGLKLQNLSRTPIAGVHAEYQKQDNIL